MSLPAPNQLTNNPKKWGLTQNEMKQENWHVGQKVWDEALFPGKCGKVNSVTFGGTYPIRILFGGLTDGIYTESGAFQSNVHPTLKPYPHRIEIHRIEPEFEKGQIVLVRDNNDENWIAARYYGKDASSFHNVTLHDSICVMAYNYCIPFAGNEHLLLTTLEP